MKASSGIRNLWILSVLAALCLGSSTPSLLFATESSSSTCAINLSKLSRPLFIDTKGFEATQEITRRLDAMTAERYRDLRGRTDETMGTRMELEPLVVDPEIYETIQAAARQRVEAFALFLRDIYSGRGEIYKKIPELQAVVESSAFYVPEVVGTEVADSPWDILASTDWVIHNNPDGTQSIEILEGGSGPIGGVFFTGLTQRALNQAFPDIPLRDEFVPNDEYLSHLMQQHLLRAQEFGKDRVVLVYREAIPVIPPGATPEERNRKRYDATMPQSELAKMLNGYGVSVASVWNKGDIVWDPEAGLYRFTKRYYDADTGQLVAPKDEKGHPIGSFHLKYYQQPLDPQDFPSSESLSPKFTTAHHRQHQIPGFWSNYIQGGFERWHTNQRLGSQLMSDKAFMMFMPRIVEFYLNQQALLGDGKYRMFVDPSTERKDWEFIREVFERDPAKWVVKSRKISDSGEGVFVLKRMLEGKKVLFTRGDEEVEMDMNDLKAMVSESPLDWVVQEWLDESSFTVDTTWSGTRHIEGRSIAYTFDDEAHSISSMILRSSVPGHSRTMGIPRDANAEVLMGSMIPVLVPRQP